MTKKSYGFRPSFKVPYLSKIIFGYWDCEPSPTRLKGKSASYLVKDRLIKVDYRAVIISSCWIAIAVIASVYMYLFADKIGDVLFGVFLPVGLLILVALVVTFVVSSSSREKK